MSGMSGRSSPCYPAVQKALSEMRVKLRVKAEVEVRTLKTHRSIWLEPKTFISKTSIKFIA